MNFLFNSAKCGFKTCTSTKINSLPHLHHYAEVIYIVTGELRLFIGQNDCLLHTGDTAVIFPNDVHYGQGSDDFKMLQFTFAADFLSEEIAGIMNNYSMHVPFIEYSRLNALSRNTLNTIIEHDLDSNAPCDDLYRATAYKGVLLILINDILSKSELKPKVCTISKKHRAAIS